MIRQAVARLSPRFPGLTAASGRGAVFAARGQSARCDIRGRPGLQSWSSAVANPPLVGISPPRAAMRGRPERRCLSACVADKRGNSAPWTSRSAAAAQSALESPAPVQPEKSSLEQPPGHIWPPASSLSAVGSSGPNASLLLAGPPRETRGPTDCLARGVGATCICRDRPPREAHVARHRRGCRLAQDVIGQEVERISPAIDRHNREWPLQRRCPRNRTAPTG